MSLPEAPLLPTLPASSFADALGHAPTDKRIDILRLIGQRGSISQAAREAGVSYKAAWQAIDTLTNLAGVELVTRAVGGAGGGGASLSRAGEQLLAAAGQLEQARQQVLAGLQAGFASGDASGSAQGAVQVATLGVLPSLNQLSVRTSMRNQLPCKVQALDMKGHIVLVKLVFASGGTLVSRITLESAELLSLRPGQPVLALCKATAVTVIKAGVVPDLAPGLQSDLELDRTATGNQLPGRAARVSRGPSGDEVSLTLDSGLQLVGFASPGSGIRVGTKVLARVDEAAVVVALAG